MKLATNRDHSVLRYTLCFQALAAWLSIAPFSSSDATRQQVCVNNATSSSMVNIICGDSSTIEVLSIYYDHRQTFSGTCEAPTGNNNCRQILKTGPELGSKELYDQCSESQICYTPVGALPDIGCPNVTPNFVLIEYNCVPGTDFIDLCGDDSNIISAIKHLAYFRRFNEGLFQICTCWIHGSHTLTAVYVPIPTISNYMSEHLDIELEPTINSENNRSITSGQESMINVDFKELQSSHITLVNTYKSLTPPVWFKIKPDNGATVLIKCLSSIETSSSSRPPNSRPISPVSTSKITAVSETPQTTLVTTDDCITTEATISTSPLTSPLDTDLTTGGTASFSPDRATSTKVPVIVGSVVGGLVLICIIVVLIVIVLSLRTQCEDSPAEEVIREWRKQKLLRGENPSKTAPNQTSEHDDFLNKRTPSYVNVKTDPDINHRNGNVSNGLEGMNSTNYEDVASYNEIDNRRRVQEYENTSGSLDMPGNRPDHTTNPLKGTGNTYENTNVTGNKNQIYVNEVFDDQQYSTLDYNEDNPGHYERLKVH